LAYSIHIFPILCLTISLTLVKATWYQVFARVRSFPGYLCKTVKFT